MQSCVLVFEAGGQCADCLVHISTLFRLLFLSSPNRCSIKSLYTWLSNGSYVLSLHGLHSKTPNVFHRDKCVQRVSACPWTYASGPSFCMSLLLIRNSACQVNLYYVYVYSHLVLIRKQRCKIFNLKWRLLRHWLHFSNFLSSHYLSLSQSLGFGYQRGLCGSMPEQDRP